MADSTATMTTIPPELLLDMAEEMDMSTMSAFMQTNKSIREVLQTYETSISKTKASNFLVTPTAHVLSSVGPEREILHKNTFGYVAELELREDRINQILRSNFINTAGPIGLDPLKVRQQQHLTQLLEKAIYQCDQLADMAANTKQGPPPVEYYDAMHAGVWAISRGLSTIGSNPWSQAVPLLPPEIRKFDPFTNVHARPSQIEYIHKLSLDEAVVLLYLIQLTGSGFVRTRKYEADDPIVWEKLTVFEESVLRHGSWFLWAYVRGKEDMRAMTGHMIEAGLVELHDWEDGRDETMVDGLRMNLLDVIRNKLDIDPDDPDVAYHMMKRMTKILTVDA